MFSMYGASGFYKAPISKGLMGSAIISSFAMMFPLHHHRHLLFSNTQLVLEKKQPWRLLTSKLAFLDAKDLVICSLLMYYFRIFERRFGSRKFASYLLATSAMAVLLEALALLLCHSLSIALNLMPSGPLCCVFPLFVPYYMDIPRVAITHILGVPVTGKTFTYILGFQVASGSSESRVAAACGLVAGLLWHNNFLWVQRWARVPALVALACHKTVGHLLESKPPGGQVLPMGATLELQRQEHMDRLERQLMQNLLANSPPRPQARNLAHGPGIFGNQNLPEELRQRHEMRNGDAGGNAEALDRSSASQVSEDQVQLLMEMGFSQDRVRHALQVTNNDIDLATNVLLQEA